MKDGPTRKTIKRIALFVFDAHLAMHRWQAKRYGLASYDLGGNCGGCGMCCEAPGIQVSKLTWYLPNVRRLLVWWHRVVNRFELIETRRAERAFIFRCAHFDPETRQCDSYESRPGMCRDYPRQQMHSASPQLFKECGYYPLDKKRDSLVQILAEQDLTSDQMGKLRSGLYLTEESRCDRPKDT